MQSSVLVMSTQTSHHGRCNWVILQRQKRQKIHWLVKVVVTGMSSSAVISAALTARCHTNKTTFYWQQLVDVDCICTAHYVAPQMCCVCRYIIKCQSEGVLARHWIWTSLAVNSTSLDWQQKKHDGWTDCDDLMVWAVSCWYISPVPRLTCSPVWLQCCAGIFHLFLDSPVHRCEQSAAGIYHLLLHSPVHLCDCSVVLVYFTCSQTHLFTGVSSQLLVYITCS